MLFTGAEGTFTIARAIRVYDFFYSFDAARDKAVKTGVYGFESNASSFRYARDPRNR